MAKKSEQKKNRFLKIVMCFLCMILGSVGGFYALNFITLPKYEDVSVFEEIYTPSSDIDFADTSNFQSDISIHFLELGNKYTGDCTFIQTPQADILIDCGSKSNSVQVVAEYLKNYVTDGILEYVIVTHAHQDHYAGFATSEKQESIFDLFQVETIIDFAKTNQKTTSTTYSNYLRERSEAVERGAKHFTAKQCIDGGENGEENNGQGARSLFDIGKGISLNILDSYYYNNKASNENEYSVCCMISQESESGQKQFLFTGDLEEKGEEYLVKLNSNKLKQVELFKAGHHGSKTSSTEVLLSVICPKVVCVCCCAGSSEYTTINANQFPTQDFINRVAKYTDKIFVTTLCVDYKKGEFTSFNGNIVFMSNKTAIAVKCSHNDIILKDSDWFLKNRTWPSEESA